MEEKAPEPRGWYSRGYLPHFDGVETTQFVTFHLADSLPTIVLAQWREELQHLSDGDRDRELRKKIEKYLDAGHGELHLGNPQVAELTQNALLYFDGERYRLHDWVVMPNHVHVLFTPCVGISLGSILHSWKSYTSNQANRMLNRSGEFWYTEYHDRYIRDQRHFVSARNYIDMNPVKAGLCEKSELWEWGSARLRHKDVDG